MNKWKIIAAVVLVIALLSFNWDRIELESRAFVVTLGIDGSENDDARFEVSMNIAHTADRESGGTDEVILRRAEGDSLAHAMGQVEAAISEKVYFGHTKAIVLGEAVLQDAGLLREVVDTLSRNNEINIKATVVATDETAAELLAARPKKQGLLGVYLSGFFNSNLNSTNSAASAVKLDLEHLDLNLLISGSVLIPLITLDSDEDDDSAEDADNGDKSADAGDKEVIISGVAVVRDYVLSGRIEQSCMGGFLWLKQDAAGTRVVLEKSDNDSRLTFLTRHSKARKHFIEENGVLHCRIALNVEGGIQAADYLGDSGLHFDSQGMAAYEDDFAAKIKAEAEELFEQLQELGVDGLGLKEALRKKDRTLYRKFASNWHTTYAEMVFKVDVNVKIRNAGAIK